MNKNSNIGQIQLQWTQGRKLDRALQQLSRVEIIELSNLGIIKMVQELDSGQHRNHQLQVKQHLRNQHCKIQNRQSRGSGHYNQKGQKIGFWVELNPLFSKDFLVINEGIYIDGVKSGQWVIKSKEFDENSYQIIGQGNYINGLKDGIWIELCEEVKSQSQLMYKGKYNNGSKSGIWELYNRNSKYVVFNQENTKIVCYDQSDKKQGSWLEFINSCSPEIQLVQFGTYWNNERIDRWDIFLFDYLFISRQQQNRNQLYRAGGRYQNGKKEGKWIEYISQNKLEWGDYKNGEKHGVWFSDGKGELQTEKENQKSYLCFYGQYKNLINQKECESQKTFVDTEFSIRLNHRKVLRCDF